MIIDLWWMEAIDAALDKFDSRMHSLAGTVLHPKMYADIRRYAMVEALIAAQEKQEEWDEQDGTLES